MTIKKSVVIIGAGIGGITTAIYLARQGYSVSVYEKNAAPGGRCGQIIRDGHRFDLGATIFLMPEIYRSVFQSLGLSLEKDFKTTPLETLYKMYFGDGSTLLFSPEKNLLREQLERIEKGSFEKSQELIKNGYRYFRMATDHLLARNFYKITEFATFRNAILLLRLKTYIRHVVWIRRYFKNENLRKAFTFQNIYVGQDPNAAPALFAMLSAAELTEGSLFPVGGMYSITEKLMTLACDAGVQFVYNAPVTAIHTDKKSATGVTVNGHTLSADMIVANADLPYVYRELLPPGKTSRKIESLKYSCSAIVLHWGLDKCYPQLSHHSVFLSEDYDNNLRRIFHDHSIADKPSFYIHSPVRSDPGAAPEGQDSLTIVIPSGNYSQGHDQNWNELKNTARSSVIERLKKQGLEDIEDHIKFEICYLPSTWKSIFNLSKGATFGSLGHNILQMGYFRPHNRHAKYKNLYFTGGSTHPGSGIPLVLLSAKLTSERILKDMSHG